MAQKNHTNITDIQPRENATILPTIVFVVCMVVTIIITRSFQKNEDRIAFANFENKADNVVETIDSRMSEYIQALRGGQALFAASTSVERDEWQQYYTALHLPEQLPGIQAFAYSKHIKDKADIPAIEELVRNEGFPSFSIWPDPTNRDDVHSIMYIEPMDERNKKAFGYDMSSELIRRNAMFQTRDTGEPTLSGKVTLVQEITDDVQAGTLLYVPVYTNGVSTNTTLERQNNLEGFVYAAFRMEDLISETLKVLNLNGVGFVISDEAAHLVGNDAVLYDSRSQDQKQHPEMITTRTIEIAGAIWHIQFAADSSFIMSSIRKESIIILATGFAISSLITLLFIFGTRTQARASRMATRMTKTLRTNKERLRSIYTISATSNLSIEDQIQQMLDVGTRELGLEQGIVSRITDEVYEVAYSSSKGIAQKGTHIPLRETYCKMVLEKDSVFAVHQFATSEYKESTCYKKLKLESYIGNKIIINGKTYGTVSFNSKKAHEPFTEDDKEFIRLITRFIASALEREHAIQALKQQKEELEKSNRMMVGREIKMRELKDKINQLESASDTSNTHEN